jgi:hypothetical protein
VYLKKIEGPRTITLPNGQMMSRSDLPPQSTRRWVASRKIAVVRGVLHGLISQEDALTIINYQLSIINCQKKNSCHGVVRLPNTAKKL